MLVPRPMMLPGFFGGGAVNIFLMRQFMRGIPDQLGEAAKIDGANKFRIYWQIVMPLCLPIIAFTMVNTFLGTWNDFMNPLLYLGSRERLYTISLGLYMDFTSYFRNEMKCSGFVQPEVLYFPERGFGTKIFSSEVEVAVHLLLFREEVWRNTFSWNKIL